MTYEELALKYLLSQESLSVLYSHIVSFLIEKGVKISYIDLEHIVETDIYKLDREIEKKDQHHESCISDGAEVFLHINMEEVGGICGRIYDLLHVGCGHLWQWSADASSGLRFYGNAAWEIGSVFYLHRPEDEIQQVWRYEREASLLALANLKLILKLHQCDAQLSQAFIMFFNDYLQTDLEYITSYYRSGKVKDFLAQWKFGSEPLPVIQMDFPIEIKERRNKCVGLISVR